VPELLLELLSEEIPARMQGRAAEDLKRLVCDGLKKAGLAFDRAEAFVTPRRLALVVDGLPEKQPDVREEKRGPRVDAPEKAIHGFLKSVGLTMDQVEKRKTGKGEFYFAVVERKGAATADVLPELFNDVFSAFSWPKSMRWGANTQRWVRPLQGILCVFGGEVVGITFGDQHASNMTLGHRFLAPKPFKVKDFADYKAKLAKAKVVLDPAERRALIASEAEKLAGKAKLTLKPDDALLDENAGLVEWPVVLMGRIDAAFMDLPAEVLTTSMRHHQKYFALLDKDGNLAPRFIFVANTETRDKGRAIVAGNERVLKARLADAKFFRDQDRKRTLESRVPDLAGRIFHARLGTVADKAERIAGLARGLAGYADADPALAERAARLCKADLSTEMVGEFPELQGTMGRYYALNDGEKADVADAIAGHYAPLGPNDSCPKAPVGVAVALADKIDSLVGFFAIDERPTGSKDPFALRRSALGVIRLIIENGLRLPLAEIFREANRLYADSGLTGHLDPQELLDFFADRLKVHLREKGVRHDLISAVFEVGGEDDLVRLLARVEALGDFLATDDGANLLTAYRRAANIVRIEEKRDRARYDGAADETLLSQGQERALFDGLAEARAKSAPALADEKFALAMSALARLRGPVDAFFDHVTVNCEEPALRVNRLRLLSQIRSTLSGIADFSRIEGGER
jgi:glycyl-tRNA synthetase beta chain